MNLAFDLKYAWRLLRKSWGYSLMCAAVVALSVGLAVWTYAVVYAQWFKPLGLQGADQWYGVQLATGAGATPQPGSVDAYTYQKMLEQSRSVEHVGAYGFKRVVLSEGQASTALRGGLATPRLLAQVKPLMGRTLVESDGRQDATPVALLTYETWQNYFAGEPNVVGRSARIDSAPVQIVGVLPKDFWALQDFEVWMPLQTLALARPGDSKQMLQPLIALRNGQTVDAARTELKSIVARVNGDYPDLFSDKRRVAVMPANRMYTHSATPIIAMLMFMAVGVLVLGGVNISMVFLARLLERSRELALRTALGASRGRLLRQCLIETALIVIVGLGAGYGLAALGIRWTQWLTGVMARVLAIGRIEAYMELRPIDAVAPIVFGVAIWLLSTLVPAWRIARQDAAMVLAGSGKGASNRRGNKGAGLLVGFQVVISCLVVIVCGCMAFAVYEETTRPLGIDTKNIMVSTSPTLLQTRYEEPSQRLRYWENLTAAIQNQIPGSEVAITTAAPSRPRAVPATIESRAGGERDAAFKLPLTVVSDNYFSLLGLKLRSGRLFDRTDNESSLPVAVVDEDLARRYWPKDNVLGKRVQLNPADNGPWLTIVGVVNSVGGARAYSKEDIGVIYQPLRQAVPQQFQLVAKLPALAANSRSQLRAAAYSVDRDLPLNNLQELGEYVAALRLPNQSLVPIGSTFALITLVIAASGLFGLITRSVAQRTQEVGIRRALGATAGRITKMFLRQGALYLTVAVVGIALGVMVMPVLSREITNILAFTVPVALGVVFLMAAIIFAASFLPSRRAVAMEPGDALRYE